MTTNGRFQLSLLLALTLFSCGAKDRPAVSDGRTDAATVSRAGAASAIEEEPLPAEQPAEQPSVSSAEPPRPAKVRPDVRQPASNPPPAAAECSSDSDCSVSAEQMASCQARPACADVRAVCWEGECRTIERRLTRSDPQNE